VELDRRGLVKETKLALAAMRALGWFFVVIGLMIGIACPVYALRHSARRGEQWHETTLKGATTALDGNRIGAYIDVILRGWVPRGAQVSP
jgi:hypothetical protein